MLLFFLQKNVEATTSYSVSAEMSALNNVLLNTFSAIMRNRRRPVVACGELPLTSSDTKRRHDQYH